MSSQIVSSFLWYPLHFGVSWGHCSQVPSCGSHSAGMRNPASDGGLLTRDSSYYVAGRAEGVFLSSPLCFTMSPFEDSPGASGGVNMHNGSGAASTHPMKIYCALGLFASLMACAPEPVHVGPREDGGFIVPTRQVIRPAGRSLEFGGRPVDLVLSPDAGTLYVKDDRGLVVIDTKEWSLRQELAFPLGGGSMHGIAVSPDGTRVYATTAEDLLWEASVSGDGTLVWGRSISLPGPQGRGPSHACGLALSEDGETLYVALSRNNTLGVVDLDSGRLTGEIPVGVAPFDVALFDKDRKAFVSNWGGRHPEPGERTADSSGTETVVDERGVARTGTVSLVDLVGRRELNQIPTDLHPSDIELNEGATRLYVANANSDTVSVIDVQTGRTTAMIDVRPDPDLPFGSMPNALALSRDGGALFVANGGNNAVAQVKLHGDGDPPRVEGFIPAGWYPGGIVTDGASLFIANVKGVGSRDEGGGDPGEGPEETGWHVDWHLGSVTGVRIPGPARLKKYTDQVRVDARIPEALHAWEVIQRGTKPVPVPTRAGEVSVFKHVVYVIKENRTYDQVFGDMPYGNNDESLCIFGREVTPNHHALAERFILLDNYYCNGINSADGHSWSTEGNVTDHLEKSFGGFTRSYTWGNDPLTYSSSGFIWDNVLANGLTFRNYGELDYADPIPEDATFTDIYQDFVRGAGRISFTHRIGIDRLREHSHPIYPGWNMNIPDVLRVKVFIEELREYERTGGFPNFMIVYLPQDHSSGTSPGFPTPRAHVADNDLALGQLIEAISHSRYWPETCVFVIEDDPQYGFDHVDGHRSICLIASPYTRRGALVSNFYNQTSVLHTMQRILGLMPMNQMDSMSPLMTDCFTTEPDFTPYAALPNRIPLDEMNPELSELSDRELYWARRSLDQDFDVIDGPDDVTLNRILWHYAKGTGTPYPVHLAGAHGTGLETLNLHIDPDAAEDDD